MTFILQVIFTFVSHDREFIYKPRGFENIEEHDEAIIERWNSVVRPNDFVYVLGDVMLGGAAQETLEKNLGYLYRLNGKILLVYGNHDTDKRVREMSYLPNIELRGYADVYKHGKYRFYLSHYPTLTSNLDNGATLKQRTLNLYGHTHQTTKFFNGNPTMYHVGCDAHNCTPVNIEDVIKDMKKEAEKCFEQI